VGVSARQRIALAAILTAAFTLATGGVAPATPTTPRCRTRELHVWLKHTGAALGTVGGYLAFTNRGRTSCSLTGWPSLTAYRPGASTSAIHVRETMFGPWQRVKGLERSFRGVPLVILEPGRSAVAAFTAGDHSGRRSGACRAPYRQLRITPPGASTSTDISAWLGGGYRVFLPSCTGIYLSMVVPASALSHLG
jgi:Protein of unknown function (DUF4232)